MQFQKIVLYKKYPISVDCHVKSHIDDYINVNICLIIMKSELKGVAAYFDVDFKRQLLLVHFTYIYYVAFPYI